MSGVLGMTRKVLLAAICVMGANGVALAQASHPGAPNPFDPNKIYRGIDQLGGMAVDALFRTSDVDGDGFLTRSEFAQAAARNSLPFAPDPRAWAAFDANRDGKVSRLEATEALQAVQTRVRSGVAPY